MGSEVEPQIIKAVDAIREGDHVARLSGDHRPLRVLLVEVEYDFGDPHAVWLTTVDVLTDIVQEKICSSRVTYPLNEMEVLAWASR